MDSRKNFFENLNGAKYKLSDFEYELPKDLIAQFPSQKRDECRLMVINRETQKIEHKTFRDVIRYLKSSDVLVINDTKVFPARLFGRKDKTGAKVEVFLLRNLKGSTWEVIVKPSRKIRIGNKIVFDDKFSCDIVDNTISGGRIVEFNTNHNFFELLDEVGNTPLPPYIKRESDDFDKLLYQTVYADKPGAVAAPTAGLHFTHELLQEIREKGIHVTPVTLHVGLGTFRPVHVDDISRHQMDSEYYEISEESAHLINEAKKQGGRVIAVGTTAVRVLESVADRIGYLRPGRGWTDKFIYPPYEFRIVDKLITNFHLPGSTLLMLVAAFSSVDLVQKSYHEAIREKYRFYSYGDAMILL